jgi:hypothetical protein
MLWMLLTLILTGPVICGAALTDLVEAAKTFSTTIRQQLETVENDPSCAEFAEQTIAYAVAKADYYKILASSIPELTEIATGRQTRPPELDQFAHAFSLAGENQEKEADQETVDLLTQFRDDQDIEKARIDFDTAEKIEATFVQEFGGIDFASQFESPIGEN